jgi:hypothetical protein
MPPAARWLFWGLISAAFAVNAWRLGAEALAWYRSSTPRRRLAAALLLLLSFGSWHFLYSGVSVRGGYDNLHDYQYAGAEFFDPSTLHITFSGKEVSPLAVDAIGDALSGFSLAAVPAWNGLLMFFSAVLLLACLLTWGLGACASAAGAAVYYFSFLSALNAHTISTTPANLCCLLSAVFAASVFELRSRDLKGLLWALCACLLVWTGRYELIFMPAALLILSLAMPGGALRSLLQGRRRAGAAVLLFLFAALCAAWAALALRTEGYNGPGPDEAFRLAEHLRYDLLERNLLLLRFPAWSPLLCFPAAALAWASRKRPARPGPVFFAVCAWALYSACIFSMREIYPLQFMRHHLYFFVPFAALAAFVWDLALPARAGRYAAASWALLGALCVLYCLANSAAALALQPQARTNDMEWRLLLDASRSWPRGTRLFYGQHDALGNVLRKYFPVVDDCGGNSENALKYIQAGCQVFGGPEAGRPYDCSGPWLPAASPAGEAWKEVSFPHRFYTTFYDREARPPVPVRIGFYRAAGAQDRAALLARAGFCALSSGDLSGAETALRSGLALDPSSGDCRLGLGAALVLQGRSAEGLAQLSRLPRSGLPSDRLKTISAVSSLAAGDRAGALAGLSDTSGRAGGRYGRYADILSRAMLREEAGEKR